MGIYQKLALLVIDFHHIPCIPLDYLSTRPSLDGRWRSTLGVRVIFSDSFCVSPIAIGIVAHKILQQRSRPCVKVTA